MDFGRIDPLGCEPARSYGLQRGRKRLEQRGAGADHAEHARRIDAVSAGRVQQLGHVDELAGCQLRGHEIPIAITNACELHLERSTEKLDSKLGRQPCVGIVNSGPLPPGSGQRCMTDLYRV